MTVSTPKGPILLADSINELSAKRWTLYHQAWAREVGADGTFYGTESHISRLGIFIAAENMGAIRGEYNNLLLNLRNITSAAPENMQAAVLAPLVVSINGQPRTDITQDGLANTIKAVLDTGISQGLLRDTVEKVKKNFSQNWP
jgi:hypothetical protein